MHGLAGHPNRTAESKQSLAVPAAEIIGFSAYRAWLCCSQGSFLPERNGKDCDGAGRSKQTLLGTIGCLRESWKIEGLRKEGLPMQGLFSDCIG